MQLSHCLTIVQIFKIGETTLLVTRPVKHSYTKLTRPQQHLRPILMKNIDRPGQDRHCVLGGGIERCALP